MAPTNEERREVAERLRDYVRLRNSFPFEAFFVRLNMALFGDNGWDRTDGDVFEHLAYLIDHTFSMDAINTGEQADYECSEHIMHCSNCNAEFGYVLYSEDRGVNIDDKPRYCPNCGARCVDE